jgi:simple sugar transport system substrate-binding protein
MTKRAFIGAGILVILTTAALAAGSTVAASPASPRASGNPPYTVQFPSGTFKLAGRISAKLKAKQTLNIVMSAQETSSPIAPADYKLGLDRGAKADSKNGFKINARLIGPVTTDPAQQIAQIEAVLNGNAVDCLAIQPVSEQGFVKIFNKAFAAGVPVFAVNTDSPHSQRFAYYGLNEFLGGQQVGRAFVKWVNKSHTKVKKIALLTGDPAASWAQDRMRGFAGVVGKALPSIKFLDSPTKAVGTTYEQPKIFAAAQAYLQGHPDVDVVVHTDEGGSVVGDVIQKLGMKGKTHVVMWNTFPAVFDEIKNGIIVLALDQALDLQAQAVEHACAQFLLAGKVPGKPIQAIPGLMVDSTNVAQARKQFFKTHPKYGG